MSKQHNDLDKNINFLLNSEQTEFVHEKSALYKYGTKNLLNNVCSAISKVAIKDLINTQGIFQFDIDTFGLTSNFEILRTLSREVDNEIAMLCDTLTFHPASSAGLKINSKFTLPIRVRLD